MNIPAIIAMIIMIIGFLSGLIFPIFIIRKINNRTTGFKKVKGEVIKFNEKFDYYHHKRVYYPIVKYTVDNKEYEIVSGVGYGLSLFMPKKLMVLYNPQNPYEAEVGNEKKLMIIIIALFSIGIILMMEFLINDLILENNEENTNKIYSYRVICNINGYLYNEVVSTEAKSSKEALKNISDKYKNWNASCEYEEVNLNTD